MTGLLSICSIKILISIIASCSSSTRPTRTCNVEESWGLEDCGRVSECSGWDCDFEVCNLDRASRVEGWTSSFDRCAELDAEGGDVEAAIAAIIAGDCESVLSPQAGVIDMLSNSGS